VTGLPGSSRAALLDCIQANLAALADQWHGPGTCLRLGASLRFRYRPATGSGLPTVEPPLGAQLTAAAPVLGLAVADRRDGLAAGELLAALGPGSPAAPAYVVADAWHLPWTPYCGRRHMQHSFLASRLPDGRVRIGDAYHNDTPWGQARPGQWPLTETELAAALRDGATTTIWFTAATPSPVRPAVDVAATDGYVQAYRQAPDRLAALDQLCLETWLLDRSRQLHAAFLASRHALDENRAAAHLAGWRTLTEQAYLALRRAERGRPEQPGLADRLQALLDADSAVFGAAAGPGATAPGTGTGGTGDQPASHATAQRHALWPRFTETVARVLRIEPSAVAAATSLADLPSWNSLRLVETIEALESQFGAQFSPEDLIPERLSDASYLFALVREAEAPRTKEAIR
jgi:acyl carrier protein